MSKSNQNAQEGASSETNVSGFALEERAPPFVRVDGAGAPSSNQFISGATPAEQRHAAAPAWQPQNAVQMLTPQMLKAASGAEGYHDDGNWALHAVAGERATPAHTGSSTAPATPFVPPQTVLSLPRPPAAPPAFPTVLPVPEPLPTPATDGVEPEHVLPQVKLSAAARGKLRFLYSGVAAKQLNKLLIDEEALYSVTDKRSADRITQLALNLPGVDKDTTVVDGTACVGGNTASFASAFASVVAVELHAARFAMLRHNLQLLGRSGNVELINGDFMSLLGRPDLAGSVVFLDPPWGGPEYKGVSAVELSLSNVPLGEICRRMRGWASYAVIKAPMNFAVGAFRQRLLASTATVPVSPGTFGGGGGTSAAAGGGEAPPSSPLPVMTVHRGVRKMLLVVVDYAGARVAGPASPAASAAAAAAAERALEERLIEALGTDNGGGSDLDACSSPDASPVLVPSFSPDAIDLAGALALGDPAFAAAAAPAAFTAATSRSTPDFEACSSPFQALSLRGPTVGSPLTSAVAVPAAINGAASVGGSSGDGGRSALLRVLRLTGTGTALQEASPQPSATFTAAATPAFEARSYGRAAPESVVTNGVASTYSARKALFDVLSVPDPQAPPMPPPPSFVALLPAGGDGFAGGFGVVPAASAGICNGNSEHDAARRALLRALDLDGESGGTFITAPVQQQSPADCREAARRALLEALALGGEPSGLGQGLAPEACGSGASKVAER